MSKCVNIVINGEVVNLCEFIKNRLYFVTISSKKPPKSSPDTYYFSIDDELVYSNYYSDFGPLNLAMLYRYCVKVNTLLRCFNNERKKLIHYTTRNLKKRTNAAFLIASYAVIYLHMSPEQSYKILLRERSCAILPFQDASIGVSSYTIDLLDCLEAVERALHYGFFNFYDFDVREYEVYEKIRYGDLNWIIPNKLLAFCGPCSNNSDVYKKPEFYLQFFKNNNVSTVVQLNKKTYNPQCFENAGINHHELYFLDGGIPPQKLVEQFLDICEASDGAIAVHCKAGLGRTGTLIACYIMKHYHFTARESIAWLRICRPGSVIGHQQTWLENTQNWFWEAGDSYRLKLSGDDKFFQYCKYGIYSIEARQKGKKFVKPLSNKADDKVKGIASSNKFAFTSELVCNDKKNQHLFDMRQYCKSKGIVCNKLQLARKMSKMDPNKIPSLKNIIAPIPFKHHYNLRSDGKWSTKSSMNGELTQGDRLNAIKRAQVKHSSNI